MKVFTSKPGLTSCIYSSPSAMNKRNSVLQALLTQYIQYISIEELNQWFPESSLSLVSLDFIVL